MNKRFFTNSFWIIGGTIIKAIIGLIMSIFTARYLGPSNYGIIGYITTIITLVTAFATLGLSNILIKEYVRHKKLSGVITGTAVILQFCASFISYIFILIFVYIFNVNDRVMNICALVQGGYHIFNCFDCLNYYYQSKFHSKVPVIISTIAYMIVQLFKIYLLITNKSVVWFSFAVCLEPLSIGLLLILTYLLKKGPRLKFSSKVAKYLVKNSSPFILSGMISVLYATIDKIMLKEMFSSTEFVGIYNVAYNLSHSWVFLLSALISAFSPIIYEAYNKKDDSVSNLRSKQLYFIIFYTSFIVGILFSIVVPFAIPIMYTDAYVKSIVPSILLIFSIPFAYVGVARIIQITSENLQKYTIVFSILTVIINFILNFIFIPLLGVSGAALGTLLSEIFVCVIVPLFFKKTRHIGKNIIESLILKGVELKNIIKTLVASIKKGNKKNEKREEK